MLNKIFKAPLGTGRLPIQSITTIKYRNFVKGYNCLADIIDINAVTPEEFREPVDIILLVDGGKYTGKATRGSLFKWVNFNRNTCSISLLLYNITPSFKIWAFMWVIKNLNYKFHYLFLDFAKNPKKEIWQARELTEQIKNRYQCTEEFRRLIIHYLTEYFKILNPCIKIHVIGGIDFDN